MKLFQEVGIKTVNLLFIAFFLFKRKEKPIFSTCRALKF